MLFCLLALVLHLLHLQPPAQPPAIPPDFWNFWTFDIRLPLLDIYFFMSLTVIYNRRMTEDIFVVIRSLLVIKRKAKLAPSLLLSGMLVKGEILC